MTTKRVRIAVAIDRNGYWFAAGWDRSDDGDSREFSLETLYMNHDTDAEGMASEPVVHYIEADVPIPEGDTVEGEVFLTAPSQPPESGDD